LGGVAARKGSHMNQKELFKQYSKRLTQEGWIRSLVCGGTVGFGACLFAAILSWMLELNGLLIPLTALLAATAVATVLFFFIRFRPSIRDCARKIDRMGLDERMITMLDLDGDESYLAQRQRQDALRALGDASPKNIRISVSTLAIILFAVFTLAGIGMTTVSTLASIGLLPTGSELMDEIVADEQEQYVSVTYIVEEGGYIEGEPDQLILLGSNAEAVLAVAEDGYVFDGWDDGGTRPERLDSGIMQDTIYIAIFVPLEEPFDGGDGMPSDFGEPLGAGGQPGGQAPSTESPSGESSDQSSGDASSDKGAGKYDDWNQIIDGKTYYRTELEQYRDEILEKLENNEELTEEEEAFIKAYISIV